MKKYNAKSGIYSVLVPSDYLFDENEGIADIYEEGRGVGAITISSFVMPSSYIFEVEAKLLDFVSSNLPNSKYVDFINKQVTYDDGECDFFSDDGRYWKCWILYKKSFAVFVSYNCSVEERLVEIDVIESIVKSIVILH